MSYISAYRISNEVLVWERTKAGREVKIFPAPYYFYVKSSNGKYLTMYGDKVRKCEFDNGREFHEARKELESSNIELFESDIPPEVKVLSQNYYNIPAPKLNTTFIDIEVDYSKDIGFASISNPYAPINSVALYHEYLNKYVVYAVPPSNDWGYGDITTTITDKLNQISPLSTNTELQIILCRNEKELLMYLMAEIEESDIICGWNSDFFDVPYIGKRLEKISKKAFEMLSFPEANKPQFRDVEVLGNTNITLDIGGRIRIDYMALFKKYEQYGRPSYKLESIADEIVPELPKLTYEGSLADLYRKDFMYFLRYNLRDTEILKGFEEHLGYVSLANEMCHLSTCLFQHVLGTIKLSEMSVINECHHELGGLVVNDVRDPAIDRQIKGALVLLPQVGEHEFVGSIDINSLYPSSIRSINISPETIRGQFTSDDKAFAELTIGSLSQLELNLETGDVEQHTADEWKTILQERKWAVSGYGTVFDQNKQGIIPVILEKWYATRKKYQKMKIEAAGTDRENYYDRLQYVYKIKLNSFYGALSNLYFRFYDIRMGESTTGTGRAILLHQCRKVNELLDGVYEVNFPQYETGKEAQESGISSDTALDSGIFNGAFEADAVIYGDTDSTYFKTYATTKEQAIKVADTVAKKVNDSFPKYMRDTFLCNPGYDTIIKTGRDLVTGRGIFVDKKRYMLHVIDSEGKPVDKIKLMGLDTKKTTLPKDVSNALNDFMKRYLKGEKWDTILLEIVDYKDTLIKANLMAIGLPKGINHIEDYTKEFNAVGDGTRLPGHIAAAIHYNKCLEEFDDKRSPKIRSGMKIKVFYLVGKYGKFISIAIPTDIELIPEWFSKFCIDREKHIQRLVDNPLKNILKAIGKDVPSRQQILVDSLLEF